MQSKAAASAAGAPQQQQIQPTQTPVAAASSVFSKTAIPATATESAVTSVVASKPADIPRKIHKTPMPSKTKPRASTAEKRPATEPVIAAKVAALPQAAEVAVDRDLVFCKFLSKGTAPQAFPAAAALANLTSSEALSRKVGSQLSCRCLTSPRSPAPTIKLCFDPWAPLELLLQTKSNLLHWGKSCATAKAGDAGRSIAEFGDPLPKGTEFLAAYVNGRSRMPEQWSVGAPLHHWIESNIDPTHVYLQRIPIGQSGADVTSFAVHMLRESLSQLLAAVFVQQKGASADERCFLNTNLQDLAKTAAAKAADAVVAGGGGWNVGGGSHNKPSRTTYLVGIDGLPSGVKHPEYLQDVVMTVLQQSASYLRARGIAHVEASTIAENKPLIPTLVLETPRHVVCADLAVHIRHALIHAASFCLSPDVMDPMPVAIPESILNPQHQGWILALSPGLPLPCIMLGTALLSCLWGCVPPSRRIPPSQPSAASAPYKWQMATSEWFDFAMRAAKHASGHHSFRLDDTLSTLIGQKTDPLAFVIRFFPTSWVDMEGDTVIGESKAVKHIVACAARATPMALVMHRVTLDVAPELDTIEATVRSGQSSGPDADNRAMRLISRQAMGVRGLSEGAVRQCEEAVPSVASCPSVLRDQQCGRAQSGAVPGVRATLALGIGCMSMSRERSEGLVRVTGGGGWTKGWLEPRQVEQMHETGRG